MRLSPLPRQSFPCAAPRASYKLAANLAGTVCNRRFGLLFRVASEEHQQCSSWRQADREVQLAFPASAMHSTGTIWTHNGIAGSTPIGELAATFLARFTPKVAAIANSLPAWLQTHVATSVTDYHRAKSAALAAGRLHATLVLSSSGWDRFSADIQDMVREHGSGASRSVDFSLVPLGEDYASRAAAVGVSAAFLTNEQVAQRFGLDVALAMYAFPFGRGSLECCPTVVVCGGYLGDTWPSDPTCPGEMRREVREHVRRNARHVERKARREAQLAAMAAGRRGGSG